MKIGLIAPYSDIAALGLRSISACLKREGFDSRMVFLPFPFPEIEYVSDFTFQYSPRILDQVKDLMSDRDIIGVSLMTNYFERAVELTRFLKKNSEAPVIWGGIHPTIRPEECLEEADMVCLGEGEEAFVELAQKMESGEPIDETKNIWLKKDGNIVKNPQRPFISDLDSLPYFDYDLEDHYVLDKETEEILQMDIDLLQRFLTKESPTKARAALFYQTIASRGCPHDCTFCCWSALKELYKDTGGRRLRRRSPEHIVGELKIVKEKMPFIKEITFSDDSFLGVSLKESKRFRDLYKKEIGLPFQCLAEPATITEEKLAVFADAGLVNIQIGVQTGSERMRKLYNRHETDEKIIKMSEIITGFIPPVRPPIYDFILDNPWETVQDKQKTLDLLCRIKRPFYLQIFALTFFPGTEVYRKAREDGIITDDNELRLVYRSQYNTREINYINLVISLFSRNIPLPALKLLANPVMVNFFHRKSFNGFYKILYNLYRKIKLAAIRLRKGPRQTAP